LLGRHELPAHGEVMGLRGLLRHSGLSGKEPAMQRVFEAYRPTMRQHLQALSEARTEVRASLQTEPFDAARLEKGLEQMRGHTNDMQRDMHAAIVDVARQLTPEQRKRMADALGALPGFREHGPRDAGGEHPR
jgi:Spy/CpxP family protein refolding chaperone